MEFKITESTGGEKHFIWAKTKNGYYDLQKDGTLRRRFLYYHRNKQQSQEFLANWLPQKGWLTGEQIEQAAKVSELCALDCSIEHWKQIVLNVDEGKNHLGARNCAICERDEGEGGQRCKNCILNNYTNIKGFDCCEEYGAFCDNPTEENAITMLNKLVEIRNKKYGNPYGACASQSEEKKMAKTINIDGKEFSEDTVKEALKKHCDFESNVVEETKLKHGDVVQNDEGLTRIVVMNNGKLTGFNEDNNFYGLNLNEWRTRCGYSIIGNVFEDY